MFGLVDNDAISNIQLDDIIRNITAQLDNILNNHSSIGDFKTVAMFVQV